MPFMPTEITIREGDTLSEIAQMFDTTVSELVELNNIENANFIRAGDTLKLPRDFLEKAKKRPEKTQKKESRATKK
jgi:LysM repeat protein